MVIWADAKMQALSGSEDQYSTIWQRRAVEYFIFQINVLLWSREMSSLLLTISSFDDETRNQENLWQCSLVYLGPALFFLNTTNENVFTVTDSVYMFRFVYHSLFISMNLLQYPCFGVHSSHIRVNQAQLTGYRYNGERHNRWPLTRMSNSRSNVSEVRLRLYLKLQAFSPPGSRWRHAVERDFDGEVRKGALISTFPRYYCHSVLNHSSFDSQEWTP